MSEADTLIVGGGIVGCVLADRLAAAGQSVILLERDCIGGGATAASMGHLLVLDDDPQELILSAYSCAQWRAEAAKLPQAAEYRASGTLWIASDDEEMAEAERKHARMNAQSIASELIDARKLYELEPALAPGLAGALHVPGDAVIYPPVAAAYFARRAATRGVQIRVGASVSGIDDDGVRLHDGGHIKARAIVLATGCALPELLPEAPVRPRKGHLLITTRAVPHIKHQLVELGYLKSARGNSQESIAFNAQPRATGQILLGSTRQFDAVDRAIDSAMLKGLLESGKRYLPGLDRLHALRIWTGFRPTTPDKQPLIGRWPAHPRLWLAAGHEGAGITTSTGTAALLAAQLLGKNLPFDAAAYAPLRFSRGVANAS